MKEVLNKMIDHPIATAFITSCVTGGVANIIRAARGVQATPAVTVNTIKPEATE